jgi:TonB family protein
MRQLVIRLIAILSLVSAGSGVVQGQTRAWIGMWELDVSQSRYGNRPAPTSLTIRISASLGEYRVEVIPIDGFGRTSRTNTITAFDGTEAAVTGEPVRIMRSYMAIDDRTFDIVDQVNGQITTRSRGAVSSDGMTLTITQKGVDQEGQAIDTVQVFRRRGPGSGIRLPRVLKEVKPQYTLEAMRAKIQGTALVDCVVKADGTVGDVEVIRSLDKIFGLDQEAIKAAKAWQFEPGTRNGEPVPVLVTIEVTFTLRPSEPMQFELRLAEYQPGAGLREALVGSGERVYLYDSALVTSADIAEARVGQDGTRFSVRIMLTPTAGQKVLAATADHTGRPVAILVNGRVMSAPLLSTPMGESIRIDGRFTKEEVEAIVRELNSARPKI